MLVLPKKNAYSSIFYAILIIGPNFIDV